MSYYDDDDYYEPHYSDGGYSSRGLKKHSAPPGVHIPNKKEAKLLRSLMSKTGLTEKELRNHKIYRKMLSDAQTADQKSPMWYRSAARLRKSAITLMKKITRKLKLPKEHPAVKEEFSREKQSDGDLRFESTQYLFNLIDNARKEQKKSARK